MSAVAQLLLRRRALRGSEAYWKASRYSGAGSLLDLSGRGHDAALPGGTNNPLFLTGATCLYLPGIAGNYASVPDNAALDIIGDIDIRVTLAADDWTPAAAGYLLAKNDGGNERSYGLQLQSTGKLALVWSVNGQVGTQVTELSSAATGIADGVTGTVRVTMDVNDGAGHYVIKFYTSTDYNGTTGTWTQLGTTVTGSSTTSIFSGGSILEIGSNAGGAGNFGIGKFLRAQVFASLDGSDKRLDIDFTDLTKYASTRTSLTAITGQTVTIVRATSGRKSVVVDRPLFVLGTDDYLSVADSDRLDFAAGDSFTILLAVRQFATPLSAGRYLSKQAASTGSAGYSLTASTTNLRVAAPISDGTNNVNATFTGNLTAGDVWIIGLRRNKNTATIDAIQGTVGSLSFLSAADTTGNLTNALPLRIGARSDATLTVQEFEFFAGRVFRRALTNAEIDVVARDLVAI